MAQLNFPAYDLAIRQTDGQQLIFDPLRKRYVALTPEEWVRQHVIQYLLQDKGYPSGLVSVEGSISLYKTQKRYDIAAFSRDGVPLLVVECKAPEVSINQGVVDQVVRYNLVLNAPYLFITNGLVHIVLKKEAEGYVQVKQVPRYESLAF